MRAALAGALLVAACAAPAPAPPVYAALDGQGLGTSWSVRWSAPEPLDPDAVQAAVLGALRDVDAGMSTWRDDSDLARVRAGSGPVAVGEDTAFVVREALALFRATGGAFDPTVQPLVELWGFHGTPRTAWPDDAALAAARADVGADRVVLGRAPDGRPTVDAGGTALDLSAIAKGHAVDRVGHALSGLGATDWMVEVGGEVRVAGRGPGGLWRVGVELPVPDAGAGRPLAATLALTNAALATSGNYRARYTIDGREVHHTLDPRTGLPAVSDVRSASVVAPDCRTADGWATALMVLGADAGLSLVEARPDLDAWLLVARDGGLEVRASSGMARWRPTPVEGGP